MFITMTGDATAFASLVVGYFFYWTIHPDLDAGHGGPGVAWPMLAGLLLLLGWAAMLAARALNSRSATGGMRTALVVGAALTGAGSAAGLAGPWFSGLDPTSHVYPAIVWILVLWTVVHAGAGVVMQLYCLARSFAGRLTPEYDADLRNSTLYFHFLAATALVTFAVVGLFPLAL
jgi:cytochrome c oxidase subunit I+III